MRTFVDNVYRSLAAKYLRKQAKQLASQFEGIHASADSECIHRARVASRRLRAAMGVFHVCFRAGQLEGWRREIRRVTRELGDARDQDVQIAFLRQALKTDPHEACPAGIMRLLVKWEKNRERLQPKVLRALDRLQGSGVLKKMQDVAKRMMAEAREEDPRERSPFALAQAEQHILRRLDELLAYQESLGDPEDKSQHHAMRISAKRLRYTLEICRPLYGDRLEEAIAAIKRVQTLLGDVHDCDVWTERLQVFAAKQRRKALKRYGHAGSFTQLEPGIRCVQEGRATYRREVFRELAIFWIELDGQGLWKRLRALVKARDGQSTEPGAATVDAAAAPAQETMARPEPPVQRPPAGSEGREAEADHALQVAVDGLAAESQEAGSKEEGRREIVVLLKEREALTL